MRARGLAAWLGALAATGWAGVGVAAQVGVSASVDSDYQWQGLSLSNGEPAASVSVSAEWRSGVYADLTGVAGPTDQNGVRPLVYIADLGLARRFGREASWDVGVVTSGGQLHLSRRYPFTYTQIYGGFSRGDLSAHLFYSPSYLGEAEGSLYLDVDDALRPAPHWRLVGHVGVFATLSPEPGVELEPLAGRARVDLRAGVVRELGSLEAHLFLTTTVPTPVYPTGDRERTRAILIGATYSF